MLPALGWIAWLTLLVSCSKFPADGGKEPEESSGKGNGAPPVAVMLLPDSITRSINTSFACSVQIANAPGVLAGKLHFHFNIALLEFLEPAIADSNVLSFLDYEVSQSTSPADLSILFAAPTIFPDSTTLFIMHFQTRSETGIDSIYLERSAGLTTLRDTLNQAIAIDRFGKSVIEIEN